MTFRYSFACLCLSLCSTKMLDAIGPPPGDLAQEKSLPGIVQPSAAVDLSVVHDGVVSEVLVAEGAVVTRGQLLLKLDDSVSRALVAVKQTAANQAPELDIAKHQLQLAERAFERADRIGQANAASRAEVEQAATELALARAKLAQASRNDQQAQLELAWEQARLASHHLVAPFAGTVLRVDRQPGQAAKHGEAVMRIADLTRLRAVLYVPWEWRRQLKIGQRIQLQSHLPARPQVTAHIRTLEPVLDASTRTFRCRVEIANPQQDLPAGFAVVLTRSGWTRADQPTVRTSPQRYPQTTNVGTSALWGPILRQDMPLLPTRKSADDKVALPKP